MYDAVYFNANDIRQVTGLDIIAIDTLRPADRKLTTFDIAQASLSATTSAFYKGKKIHVDCTIGRSSKENLELSLRQLESLLQGINKELRITQGGVDTTYYSVTKQTVSVNKYAGGFAEIEIEFFAGNPFAYNTSSTTLYSYPHLVGHDYSFAVNLAGNVEQEINITFTLNSALTKTNRTVTFRNPATGVELSFTRDWDTADVIQITPRTGAITINGANSVDFAGIWPLWEPGVGAIEYEDNFDASDVAIVLAYQPRNV